MSSIIGLFQLLVVCGTVLLLTMLILASLPNSKFRDVAKQVVHWLIAMFAGLYVVSPVDLMPEIVLGPFGTVDDLIALITCVLSVRSAWLLGKSGDTSTSKLSTVPAHIIDVQAKEVRRGR